MNSGEYRMSLFLPLPLQRGGDTMQMEFDPACGRHVGYSDERLFGTAIKGVGLPPMLAIEVHS